MLARRSLLAAASLPSVAQGGLRSLNPVVPDEGFLTAPTGPGLNVEIGRTIAKRLAHDGAAVMLCARGRAALDEEGRLHKPMGTGPLEIIDARTRRVSEGACRRSPLPPLLVLDDGFLSALTGPGPGVGRAIAKRLVRDGAAVVLCARGRAALDEEGPLHKPMGTGPLKMVDARTLRVTEGDCRRSPLPPPLVPDDGFLGALTGPGLGVGRAIAKRLARDGAAVMLCARGRAALDEEVPLHKPMGTGPLRFLNPVVPDEGLLTAPTGPGLKVEIREG